MDNPHNNELTLARKLALFPGEHNEILIRKIRCL